MLWGNKEEEIYFNASIPSMGFIIEHMTLQGFNYDSSVNFNLKNMLPDIYNTSSRFAVKFTKKIAHKTESQGFISAIENNTDDKIIRSWKTL
jgi:hypothetical protein